MSKSNKKSVNTSGVAGEKLSSYVQRIERLEEDKKAVSIDIREVFAEAKANGFDTKTMRQVLKIRKLEPAERDEQEYMLELYLRALGMAPDMEEAA